MKENKNFNVGEKIKVRKTEPLFSRTLEKWLSRQKIQLMDFLWFVR